jgi:hypothetical protein
LILSLSFPEHLNVTTLLDASIMSSPVAGFRPLLSRFFLTQNLPKPLINTSSPAANFDPYQINQGFDEFSRLVSRESVSLSYRFDEVGLGGGHRWGSFWFNFVIQGA